MLKEQYHESEIGFRPGFALAVCEVCGKSVERLDYDRHLRTHRVKRVETCKLCFKEFTSKLNEIIM